MEQRIQLRVELGFRGDFPAEATWGDIHEVGLEWLRHARPDVEPVGLPFKTENAAGRPLIAFFFECDEDDFFIAGRLMTKVRRVLGVEADFVAIVPAGN